LREAAATKQSGGGGDENQIANPVLLHSASPLIVILNRFCEGSASLDLQLEDPSLHSE